MTVHGGSARDDFACDDETAVDVGRDAYPAMPDNVWSERHFHGLCRTCAAQGRSVHVCDWNSCPTGGWWSHREHPEDGHDADIGWQPEQEMDDQGLIFTVGMYVIGG